MAPALTAAQFWGRFNRNGTLPAGMTTRCWVWRGARNHDGYGMCRMIRVTGVRNHRTIHRIAWLLTRGPIPRGKEVCHRCDNPPCGNPGHLFLATHHGNMLDSAAKGRMQNSANARKSHCPSGHPYDAVNTYWWRGTHRLCRVCMARRSLARTEARRARRSKSAAS